MSGVYKECSLFVFDYNSDTWRLPEIIKVSKFNGNECLHEALILEEIKLKLGPLKNFSIVLWICLNKAYKRYKFLTLFLIR